MFISKISSGIISLLLIQTLASNCQIQKTDRFYYEVGYPCPNFSYDVVNFPQKHVTLRDFKGKWLILDFWGVNCSGCIKALPKNNEAQKKYHDNVQFLLVGAQDKENKIQPFFDRLNNQLKLEIPCAFDSVIVNKILNEGAHGLPYMVFIDPTGIVRGVNWTIDGIDLSKLTSEQRPILPNFIRQEPPKIKYDPKQPYLVNRNGGKDDDFSYRSLLKEWHPGEPKIMN